MKKKPQPLTVQIPACLTALAALSSAMIAKVDPVSCLIRCAAGYLVARILAGIWCALFASTSVETNGDQVVDAPAVGVAEEVQEIAA